MSKTLTLEEAAQQLGLTTEQFKVNLKTHKDFKSVRPLMGGATMHFRAQDIDELGRRLGLGSEPELQLGDAGSDPVVPLHSEEDDDQIEIGRDRPSGGSSARIAGKSSKKLKSTPAGAQGQNPLEIDSSDEFIPLTEGSGSSKRKPGDSSTRLKKSPDSDVKVEGKPDSGKKKADDVFELAPDAPRSSKKLGGKKPVDSSEFELKLGPDSDSEFELTIADEGSDEADIGVAPKDAASKGGKSGVKLSAPADSGISLEKDSDSEFELNLDSRSSGKVTGPKSSGKSKKPTTADSDSEFELTLDDSSGEMAAHGSKPSKGSKPGKGKGDAEKDIFETDFDIPALDDESASEAVVLEEGDTDLESSDFDLALDESGVVDESASEVVELEEELEAEKDESASEALAEVDEEEERVVAPSGPPRPAKWGPLPALVLAPCMIVMFFVALMGYEMLHGMWGFRQPTKTTSPITHTIAGFFVDKSEMPKD